MMIWLIFAVLTLAVLSLLLLPLFFRPTGQSTRVEYDIVVYRDQLAEVEKDRERGLLSEDEVATVRTEVYRRMLAAEDAEIDMVAPDGRRFSRTTRWGLLSAVLVALPAAVVTMYLQLGDPALPNQPIAERQKDPSYTREILAEQTAARLREEPTAEGFAGLAATYSSLHRYDKAVAAYREAIALGQDDADTWSLMAETIVLGNDGAVVPEAGLAFRHALALDPDDVRARFYLGLSQAQSGDLRLAVSIWRSLENDGPADATWMPMLKEHIETYAKQGGFDPASIVPARPPLISQRDETTAPARPSMSSGETSLGPMEGKTPDEQEAVIRSMVAGLAVKMQANPDDLEGWLRLGQAYKVLGETDRAKDALSHAVALKPRDVSVLLSLAEIQLAGTKDGVLPDAFVKTMRAILVVEPGNVDGLYYVGEAEREAGHLATTETMWQKAVDQLPSGSPERDDIQKQLDGLRHK